MRIVSLLVFAFALGACRSYGTCESRSSAGSSVWYSCQEDLDKFYCDDSGQYFHDDAPSCASLGYDHDQGDGYFTVAEGSGSPGASGHFASEGGGGGGSSSGGSTGACAYIDHQLNRTLCEQRSSASSCTGKFFGSGTTCLGLQCPTGNDPSQCTLPGGSPGGSGSGKCGSSYQGPTGDPQVSTQCMSVWNYRCQQKNNSAADQNCLVYKSLEATVACPYCP